MSVFYFALGLLAGGTIGAVVGGALATGKRADEATERQAPVEPGPAAPYMANGSRSSLRSLHGLRDGEVCIACRFGECVEHPGNPFGGAR